MTDEITYEYDDQPKVPKLYEHKGKLYAKIIRSYMDRKGEEGRANRYLRDAKELVELTEKAILADGLEINEENVLKSIEFRFDRADEHFGDLDWGLNALIKHFNRVTKPKQSR